MAAIGLPAAFEDVHKPDQIGVDISVRIDQRMADARLRGNVHHLPEAVIGEQLCHRVAVGIGSRRNRRAA